MAKAKKAQQVAAVIEDRKPEIDSMVEVLGWEIQRAQRKIDEWAEEFKKDPAYKIGWMQDVARTAANLKVKQDLLKALTGIRDRLPGQTDEQLLQKVYIHYMKEVLRRAGETHNSTSPYSNAIECELDAAWAKLIGSWGYLYKYRPNKEEENA